jgi:hypothetical protein
MKAYIELFLEWLSDLDIAVIDMVLDENIPGREDLPCLDLPDLPP